MRTKIMKGRRINGQFSSHFKAMREPVIIDIKRAASVTWFGVTPNRAKVRVSGLRMY
jgi:hypothetical protein